MKMHTIPAVATHIALEGACNARHLGGYPAGGGVTRPYSLIRCESPHDLTDADITLLLKLGIRTVIDLRNSSEIRQHPNPFGEVETVHLHHNPIFPDDEALARFDDQPRGDSYCHMLDHWGDAFAGALRVILQSSSGVLFHCAAGKDRTGLLAALLLQNAGVDADTVAREYGYTQILLRPWMEEENRKLPHLTGEQLLQRHGALPSFLREALHHLDRAYGGVPGYLRRIGLTPAECAILREKLVMPLERIHRIPA